MGSGGTSERIETRRSGLEVAGRRTGVLAATIVSVAVVTLSLCSAALAAGDANQNSCQAPTESSPGFRNYLPDCRAYELVTPPYKQGAILLDEPGAISADGEHVIAGVPGTFAGEGNQWLKVDANPEIAVYELSRGESGWRASALTPPATRFPFSSLRAASASDELATTLWGATTSTLLYTEDLYLREPDGSFVLVGPGAGPEVAGQELIQSSNELQFVGGSGDLSHMVLAINPEEQTGGHSNVWPGDRTVDGKGDGAFSLYEYVGTGNVAPALVGVSDGTTVVNGVTLAAGAQISRCGTELGGGRHEGSNYNAVSADGETVFFTARSSTSACSVEPGEPPVDEIYARVGESTTVKISEPTRADCAACQTSSTETELKKGVFQGASQDGKRVFFLTEQELLPGRKGMNLYEYDFNGPEHGKIVLVSGGSSEPDVQSVVRISRDGSHVYFVAKGVLTIGKNAEGKEPEAEADNLYAYEPDPAKAGTSRVVFVAKLLTKTEETTLEGEEEAEKQVVNERSGQAGLSAAYEALSRGASFEEAFLDDSEVTSRTEQALKGTLGPAGTLAEDRSVWTADDARPAQATPDGRFLVFPSSADLTADDTSSVPQLFEYDAQAERLTRVSIGQGGTYNNDGNTSRFHQAPQIPVQRFGGLDLPTEAAFHLALSPDGSTVLFTSAAELAPGAVSGQPSVFEYRDGNVYLISDGRDAAIAGAGAAAVQLYGLAAGTEPQMRDAFFTTIDPLVPQQGDSEMNLYDARMDGGLPAPALAPECLGETCRGATGMAPQLGGAGSASQAGGDNVVPSPLPKARSLTRAQQRAKALKACQKRPKKKRAACRRQARKRYGGKSNAKKSAKGRK
jgi:hypothetical protein